mgnify:CR=1 FL=1
MSRARDLSRLSNPTNFTPDATTGRVGLGSENPTAKLNVAGIVSATAFYGDGSNLEGVASAGLGTALADDGAGAVIYYTDKVLGVAANITVDVPDASSSNVAYTQYEEISVATGIDFIVADGDDFVPDILGISSDVQVPGILAGGGGRVRADNFTNKAGTGAPTFQTGVNITGIVTATGGSFSGNVSVGGVLTYEDVTNIDSIGIVTARSGIRVGAGQSVGSDGAAVVYYGDGSNLTNLPAAGLTTAAGTAAGIVTTLFLSSAQDHKITASGITTITCSGGTEADSHTVRIINSGITTVGFSTFFLFPSGSTPSLPTADGAISLISFTVNRVGAGGTQLLAGASVNFS